MGAGNITLCMTVRDEAQLLAHCLRSVRGLVREVVVVDTGSRDGTRAIARRAGARVIRYEWDGSLGRARNAALREATSPWVLVLDGDEAIARGDHQKLISLTRDPRAVAYYVRLRNYSRLYDLLERWSPNDGRYPAEEAFSNCPGFSRGSILRLFRRLPEVTYEEGYSVHTNPLASLQATGGRIATCGVTIHHFQHRKGGERFITNKQRLRLKNELRHARLFDDNPWYPLNIATTYFALGRQALALRYVNRALALRPSYPQALFVRALVQRARGDATRCRLDLRRLLAITPRHADAWVVLGISLAESGQRRRAIGALREALRLRPKHPMARNSLGVVLRELGDGAGARREFERALRFCPGHPEAAFNLASFYGAVGRPAQAVPLLEAVLRENPGDREAKALWRRYSAELSSH